MEYYNNKLPRSQSPDGPVQGSLVLSEKLLRSLPLPQIRQRHCVRGEDSMLLRMKLWLLAQRKPKINDVIRERFAIWAQPKTFSDLERLTNGHCFELRWR